jgi:hypothetical protein
MSAFGGEADMPNRPQVLPKTPALFAQTYARCATNVILFHQTQILCDCRNVGRNT